VAGNGVCIRWQRAGYDNGADRICGDGDGVTVLTEFALTKLSREKRCEEKYKINFGISRDFQSGKTKYCKVELDQDVKQIDGDETKRLP
jgi:hypothetical protein